MGVYTFGIFLRRVIHKASSLASSVKSLNASLFRWAGPNLDYLCVQQLNAVPFYENYTELYFDAEHLEKGLNRGWWNFWCPFLKKKCLFWPISDTVLIF